MAVVLHMVPRIAGMVEVLRDALRRAEGGELDGLSLVCRDIQGNEVIQMAGAYHADPSLALNLSQRILDRLTPDRLTG
jgi:hypothetical protein